MEITTESLPAKQRVKATTVGRPSLPEKSRTAQTPRDYDSIFLVPNVLDARKATYIGAEVHNLTKWVVDNISPDGTSIGGYITRVMEQHYADNWNTDNNLYDAGDTGQGYTSEELFNAVSVVMGAEKRKEDRKKAGEVLSHFDGAEMFDLMCREHDEFSNQFYSLIKEYQDSKIIPRTL